MRMGSGDRIRAARQRLGISQRQLGEAVGISQAGIEKIESGKTKKSRYVHDLLRFLGLEDGPPMVPVVGYVRAGEMSITYSEGQGPFDMVEGPPGSSASTVAVALRGDSLGPAFEGWYVFYDDVRTPPTENLMGKLCVVGLADGRVVVKQLMASRTPGLYHLISQASGHTTMTDCDVAWAAQVKYLAQG